MSGSDFATALVYSWPIFAVIFSVALGAVWADQRGARREIAEVAAERDRAEADRLQTEAAYLRLRAQAPARRGQDLPRTTSDRALRSVDGGKR